MEFRGHDNYLEVVVFAPVAAHAAIRELAGLPVRAIFICFLLADLLWRNLSEHRSVEAGRPIRSHRRTRQDDQAVGRANGPNASKPCLFFLAFFQVPLTLNGISGGARQLDSSPCVPPVRQVLALGVGRQDDSRVGAANGALHEDR